ncbi:hypothetical protein [Ramlibacter alkalitolerans]|uniref:Uncharacterized protein n=1 Tax=Ramlibacter alkalitolerans TaxID=2039631 RepID=A0ABS1JHW3_9BURK|nr:hypothetical protein [Ramlibacter alkalitolerans]MBL0423800.1 hypothetical protein [Ramlibacter alkalitolerans]
MTIKSWAALVVAPTVALTTQSVMYAMVTPSCGTQTRLQLHLFAAVALAVVVVLAVLAFGESSLHRPEPGSMDSDEHHARHRFLATMATAVGAFAALVILAMWFTTWVLTPCEP